LVRLFGCPSRFFGFLPSAKVIGPDLAEMTEPWRSLGKPTPQHVPYRDPVTGSDQPSSPFPWPS
jgi:hypothetical protein